MFANPTGSFTSVEAAVVQRVRDASGGWVAPDSTLRRSKTGSYEPAASWLGTSFSGGGAGPLVTLRRGGAELALRWPTALPVPSVSGRTATYAEVLPGVDLQLTAETEGFSEVLVVKNAAAAANPALTAVRFTTAVTGAQFKTGDGGSLSVVDAKGVALFGSGTPAMWDSSGGSMVSARSAGEARASVMPLSLEGKEIVVRPDLAVLRGAATKFPVYIDPAFGASAWTMINSRYPNQSYWSYDRNGCPSPYSSVQCAKVGYTDEGTSMIYRSIFRFPTSSFAGKHVLDAKVSVDLLHSWTCSKTRTNLHLVNPINAGTTWNNNAGSWGGPIAILDNNTCNRARVRSEWGATGAAQTAAANWWGDVTLGLRAGDEANHNAWKKFDAGTALLTVTYNSYPNAPDLMTVSGNGCVTGADRPVVKTATPELRARTSDPDGTAQLNNVTFWWWPVGGTRNDNDRVTQNSVTPGQQAIVSIPPGRLVNDVSYVFQVQAYDGIDTGQFSQTCEFKVDTAPPNPPSQVTSTDYPSDGQRHGGAGIAGTFTFFPPASIPSDFAGYAYTLDTGTSAANAIKVAANPGDQKATVGITPPTDDAFTLRVWSRDGGGNFSASPTSYAFSVKAGAGPDARWKLDEGTGSTAADASNHGNTMTVANPVWVASRGGTGKALSFNGTNATAVTSGPVATKSPTTGAPTTVRTDANFTVSAWVKVDTLNGTGQYVAVSQDGTRTSPWALAYQGPTNRWRFAMTGSDVDAPALYQVSSDAAPTAGKWTYLVATYDVATHQMRLYVDGVAQAGVATVTGGFNATGPVVLGRRMWAGGVDSFFNGSVDDVRIYGRVLGTTEPEFSNSLNPESPLVTFPNGNATQVNQPIQVTFNGGGDPAVTTVKYSLGAAGLGSTATLTPAGGQVTVTVTPVAAGEVRLFAQAVTSAGRLSAITSTLIQVVTPPSLTGTVVDVMSGSAVAGATVTLQPGGATRVTGVDGVYEFTGLTAGLYIVSAVVPGSCGVFASTQVEVTGKTYADLQLFPQSDVFGYTCTESAQPFVAADTTVLPLTGDDNVTQISLPFAMPFYGQSLASAWVSTNGLLTFANPGSDSLGTNGSIPNPSVPNSIVAPFWADLYIDGSASVRTTVVGVAPARKFVVEWRNAAFYNDFPRRITFEAVLSENGDITFNYASLDDAKERGETATVGVESNGGSYGLQYSFNQPMLTSGKSIAIDYPDYAQPISTWTVSGTVTQGGSPVAGATVTLLPQGTTVTTAANGAYSFSNLEQDGYTVTAAYGCAAVSQPVYLAGNTTVNLPLTAVPDGFGYTCSTSTQSFVNADTTVLPLTGDEGVTQVTLPFPVTYYGQSYSSVWVSTNGFASFTNPGGAHADDRTAVPNAAGPNAALYAFWDDLVVDGSASVRTTTLGSAPNRKFVIEWRNVYIYGNTSRRVTFEVLIGENGTVTFNYTGLDNTAERGATTVAGIEDHTGAVGQTYSSFQPSLVDNRAITYTPPAP
ncbi:hypothetical protein F4553_000908 [Allocatelliglobosispora scoriae]|uniref:LamG-like jellyroll fold domain-containing protein n=1 Tax=Allocatelliglobosispora scoriae TaxID=643052 RepID=A0A841BK30_9ACTN|nr:LamG-like jellyroll fold domain-containing protein [Allocatelliglobosispora scoriae]MBB5867529.1 hypothetical protein [Allocatelliglobosispora scoriae]